MDAEIKVCSVETPEVTTVLPVKPGVRVTGFLLVTP